MRLNRLDDGRYKLETMTGQSLTCSEHELLVLATLADSLRGELKQLSSRGAVTTTKVSRIVVSIDAHHTQVFLQFFDDDYRQAFALSPVQAATVRDGIGYQLEAIDKARNDRPPQ